MANVAHSTLTGAELHEPKGADTAAAGTVYVANGSGSGSWADVGTASFTGMVADFITPVAPSGWLELDGSVISTSTYSGLYGVMAMQSSGTRTNGSAVVTSIPSTAQFKVGYYVFGTGIATGTTILTIDSATQVTLSGNASSSGSSTFAVSPWLLNTGTIKLPDTTTAGRFRRSRTSSTKVGDLQADQNQAHTHTVTGLPSLGSLSVVSDGSHTHVVSDPGHSHTYTMPTVTTNAQPNTQSYGSVTSSTTGTSTTGITINSGGAHTHALTGALGLGTLGTASNGSSEARPLSLVVITCVKT